ncbi:hypothetical protein KC354_g5813 [Hortaea werneckii]|uniref:TUG ubiquitin-like domain-containing protein n=1 Tax=Hortaea werneckii TaxID=91943 RepID=A0A3M7EBT8_HORWE|nr:hypothetical protein KC354_g5813 [Hortaea werneckii]RMY73606.1 hypothetical protein D0863_03772 [Hortaea werneckii]
MASNVFVVDSSLKRTQIKVTPSTTLKEVLDQACRNKKLKPEEFMLKTQNGKTVDLSQPFRLSGLTAGAKLQLTQASRSTGVVNLALQLPDSIEGGGRRVSDKFPSTTSLWLVLRKYEDGVAGSGQRLNLTQRGVPSSESGAGRMMYEQPCLQIMGRTLETFEDLQKTLAQVGLNSGSVLMRLSFKRGGQPLEEAMQEISKYFVSAQSAEPAASAATSAQSTNDGPADRSVPNADAENAAAPVEGAAGKEPNEDVPMTDGPTAPVVENDVLASSSETPAQPSSEPQQQQQPSNTINGISVYRPPSSGTPAAAQMADDPTGFEPSIDQAKAHQAAIARNTRNQRLLSDKELEEQETAKRERLTTVQSVQVRVRYPDQSMIETTCAASETGADLYTKVRGTLAASGDEPFELRFLGPKGQQTVPDSSSVRLVRDLGFRGKILVTLAWGQDVSPQTKQGPSLKEEYRSRATDLKVDLQQQSQQSSSSLGGKEGQGGGGEEAAQSEKAEGKKKGGGGDVEAKMKKFLGFGRK